MTAAERTSLVVPASGGDVLTGGQSLRSPGGRITLVMQTDGNLVEYNHRGDVVWHTGTAGRAGARLVLQHDGNLVLYGPADQVLWTSGSRTTPGARLVLQDDANLVLYGPSGPVWFNGAVDDGLSGGKLLRAGDWLSSPDRRSRLVMQGDGNLVVYGPGNAVRWQAGTAGNPGAFLAVQADGNVVLYRADGRPLWATMAFGGGARLSLVDEGYLVVRAAGGRLLWSPPPPVQVPAAGNGRFTAADFPAWIRPNATGRTVRFSVEVEGGITVDPTRFAEDVAVTLLDERGWQRLDGIRFEPVSAARVRAGERVDVRVTLASPATVDRLCAPLKTGGRVSCWNGSRAMINGLRWRDGVPHYNGDLAGYRTYVISHEVGHGVGHRHVGCPAPGRPAPVMLQQTYGLQGCTPWPWPRRP